MDEYAKYFDLDERAYLESSENSYVTGEKETAKFAYRMKRDAHQLLMAGFTGDPSKAGIDPLSTNFCYLAPTAAPALLAMKEWDIELQTIGKSFEFRYFWNFTRPPTLYSKIPIWIARLDIYFVRGLERRSIALWVDSFTQTAFLQALDKLPDLIVMAAPRSNQQPDIEADFDRIIEPDFPVIWVGLDTPIANQGLRIYLETVDQYLEMAQKASKVQRQDNPTDPLAVYRAYTRKPKKR